MIGDVGLAVVLFASTNIDDLFVLLALFADRRVGTRGIVIGQYLGIAGLFAFSAGVSTVSFLLSREQTGLLGILPVLIGLGKLVALFRHPEDNREGREQGAAAAFGVAAITIANGGDNVGVYTPFFATRSVAEIGLVAAVFALMTALWLTVGHGLVSHQRLGAPLRRHGQQVLPFMLIGIGTIILHEAGSATLLQRWWQAWHW